MSTTVAETGTRALYQSPGVGYPVGWYPVTVSSALGKGELLGTEFCDGRIVAYRGEDGVVRVTSSYCRHMGSDLGVGKVVGNNIQCAFHHWEYGGDGRCTLIPSGDRIPTSARLHSFPVAESFGLIWAYWGPGEPVYPVPTFTDWDDEKWVSRAFEMPLHKPLHCEPWVSLTNAFDFQHFRVVHKMPLEHPEVTWSKWGAQWTTEYPHPLIGTMTMTLYVVGPNTVVTRSLRGDEVIQHMVGVGAFGPNTTKLFCVVAAERGDNAEKVLDEQSALHTQISNEDIDILNTLRFGDNHFVSADRHLVKYLRWLREYPRATMQELEDI
jgi:nitrite reductase/ring-hydroxylating ferredoxin subunit